VRDAHPCRHPAQLSSSGACLGPGQPVSRWSESLYEPETFAFGGIRGIDIAHSIFHADSDAILTYLQDCSHTQRGTPAGRREVSILLCATLFRGARLDQHEQGDTWHRAGQMRRISRETSADQLRGMIPALRRLMTMDTSPVGTLFDPNGPLHFAAPWSAAFAEAGRQLADAARGGTLERGLRDVLAHHVIFHWNRLGLPADTQAVLARAARDTLMNTADQAGRNEGNR
jgi:thiopeptide-type bacteriocin biosynthesis protein